MLPKGAHQTRISEYVTGKSAILKAVEACIPLHAQGNSSALNTPETFFKKRKSQRPWIGKCSKEREREIPNVRNGDWMGLKPGARSSVLDNRNHCCLPADGKLSPPGEETAASGREDSVAHVGSSSCQEQPPPSAAPRL